MIFLGMGINTYDINLPFLNGDSSRGYYAFFFGILLAGMLTKQIKHKYTLMCCGLLVTIPILLIFSNDFMSTGINYIMTFLFYPSLIVISKSKGINTILNKKIIGLIGKASFDVYIWHSPFFLLLFILMKVLNWNLNLNSRKTMVGYTIICFAFALFSYICIEMPISRFVKKRMVDKQEGNV